jgi:CheY-like chemotaxis protein
MSNMQDSFLGKVSKTIKKRIFDEEPDALSDSLLIKRLQSFAGSVSSASAHASAVAPPEDASNQATEPTTEAADLLQQYPDLSPMEELPISENQDPIITSGPMGTILVVEDDIVTQRVMKKILEERGYEVIVAADGVEALMTLGKMNFDLILCDINMPNMDGFALMEYLNQKEIIIPVVFVTVREDEEDEIKGLALGSKDYIRKPVNRDLLLLRIRKALDK